jgi:hypothetical protein
VNSRLLGSHGSEVVGNEEVAEDGREFWAYYQPAKPLDSHLLGSQGDEGVGEQEDAEGNQDHGVVQAISAQSNARPGGSHEGHTHQSYPRVGSESLA